MARTFLMLVLILVAALPAASQDMNAVRRRLVAALEESGASDEAVSRFEAMARRVTDSLDRKDRERLFGLNPSDGVREIVARWRRLRDRDVGDYVKANPEARRFGREERVRRAFDGKVAAALEQTIDRAMAYGAITDDEADALRALEGRAKTSGLRELAKEVFLLAWEEVLPAEEIERLKALDAGAFWREPAVRRFRLAAAVSAAERRALKRVPRAERELLTEAVADGRSLADFVARGVLPEGLARRLESVPPQKRAKVARELARIHFQQEKRLAIPRSVMQDLDADQRRQLRGLSNEERVRWLEKNLPGRDWSAYAETFRRRRSLERILETLPARDRREVLRGLTRGDRHRLQRMGAGEQLRHLKRRFPDARWAR